MHGSSWTTVALGTPAANNNWMSSTRPTAFDGVAAGLDEVLVDEETRAVKTLLSQPPSVLYAPFTTGADERRVPADHR